MSCGGWSWWSPVRWFRSWCEGGVDVVSGCWPRRQGLVEKGAQPFGGDWAGVGVGVGEGLFDRCRRLAVALHSDLGQRVRDGQLLRRVPTTRSTGADRCSGPVAALLAAAERGIRCRPTRRAARRRGFGRAAGPGSRPGRGTACGAATSWSRPGTPRTATPRRALCCGHRARWPSATTAGSDSAECADALLGHQGDDRGGVGGVQRLDGVGDGVEPAGRRDVRPAAWWSASGS